LPKPRKFKPVQVMHCSLKNNPFSYRLWLGQILSDFIDRRWKTNVSS